MTEKRRFLRGMVAWVGFATVLSTPDGLSSPAVSDTRTDYFGNIVTFFTVLFLTLGTMFGVQGPSITPPVAISLIQSAPYLRSRRTAGPICSTLSAMLGWRREPIWDDGKKSGGSQSPSP